MKANLSSRGDFLRHLKTLGLIILFAGFPLAVAAGVYQQTNYLSHAQVAGMQIMPNNPLSRLSPPPPPPSGCFYKPDYSRCPLSANTAVPPCRDGENCTCPQILICPSITPPSTTVTIVPPPTLTITPPPGCRVLPCTIACPATNPNCCPVRYFCPSGTPPVTSITPEPSCFPRPPCLDFNPACKLPTPAIKFCPPSITPGAIRANSIDTQSQTQNSFLIYLNSFFRSFFNRR